MKISNTQFHEKNFKLLYETLIENGYPVNFIQTYVQKTLEKLNNSPVTTKKTFEKCIAIPYTKGLFEHIKGLF